MEALPPQPLHLHLPSNFIATRRLRFLFLFLLFIILMSCLPSYCDGVCEKSFTCGFYHLEHPFGKKNSRCGDPALQVECDVFYGMPLLNISGYQYYILQPQIFLAGNSSHRMTIIDRNLWLDICNESSSQSTAKFWSSRQFHIVPGFQNITLWGRCGSEENADFLSNSASKLDCSDNWYGSITSNLSWSMQHCKSKFQLPVWKDYKLPRSTNLVEGLKAGFEIKWSFSKGCEDCVARNATCMYNNNSAGSFCVGGNGLSTKSKSNTTIIVLVVATLGIALLIVAVLMVMANRKRSSFSKKQAVRMEHNNARSISNVEEFLHNYVHEMPARYSYSQLKHITNNFAHKLGEGGFGVVYKGKLPTGNVVAVKMLDPSRQSETQFMNEVATIGRIHHINLVRLLGYCFEGFTSALVYEYMANGSLDKFIHAGKEKLKILCWEQLYSIALGAARGIAYLHDECHHRIIHFDIKPHNILLDGEFTAKVADFGLAKLCGRRDEHVSMTAARGTPGYVAPEVWSRNMGPVTDKSDVYGFGMTLMEMVGGRKNIDLQAIRSSQLYFPDWAFKLIESGELGMRLIDKDGGKLEAVEEEKATKLTKVGLWCIQYNYADRPSMKRVVQMLEGSADDVINPPLPFNAAPQASILRAGEESSSS